MSKHRQEKQPARPVEAVPVPTPVVAPIEAAAPEPRKRIIEEYRHCPVCWNGNGGFGDCYSTQGRTRYYKCVQTTKPDGPGPCGHTWTALVKLEVIRVEHRIVELDGER